MDKPSKVGCGSNQLTIIAREPSPPSYFLVIFRPLLAYPMREQQQTTRRLACIGEDNPQMVEAYFQRQVRNGNPIYPSDLESILLSSHPSRLSCKLGEFISGQQRKKDRRKVYSFFPCAFFLSLLWHAPFGPLGRSMPVARTKWVTIPFAS